MRRSTKNVAFDKISKKDRDSIIFDLIYAIANCKSVEEAAVFMEDLLTVSELEFISRRLRIAKLLIDGKTYEDIKDRLHVSNSTIAKIAVWLSSKGDGFRKIVKAFPKEPTLKDPMEYSTWTDLKREYPAYFLPEIIIEQIISMANKKQKEHLRKVVSDLDSSLKEKSQLHRNIELLLKS